MAQGRGGSVLPRLGADRSHAPESIGSVLQQFCTLSYSKIRRVVLSKASTSCDLNAGIVLRSRAPRKDYDFDVFVYLRVMCAALSVCTCIVRHWLGTRFLLVVPLQPVRQPLCLLRSAQACP